MAVHLSRFHPYHSLNAKTAQSDQSSAEIISRPILRGAVPPDAVHRPRCFRPIVLIADERPQTNQQYSDALAKKLNQLALEKATIRFRQFPEVKFDENYPDAYFPEVFFYFRNSNCILEIYYALKKFAETWSAPRLNRTT